MKKLIQDFLQKASGSDFAKNVLTVMSGTVISQIIALGATPILTRNYSPEDFGVLLVYMSILTIVGTGSTGKFERAILLVKEKADISKLILLCFIISLSFSIALFLTLYLFSENIQNWLAIEKYYEVFYSLAILIVIYSLYLVFNVVLNYFKMFKKLSTAKVIKTLSSVTVSLLCIFFLKDARGLILGEFTGYLIATIFVVHANKHLFLFNNTALSGMSQLFKRFKNFPIYNIPSDFMNMASAQMPAFFLTSYFGSGVTGYYSLMKRVLDAPTKLLSTSILEVFRQEAAKQYIEKGQCRVLFKKTAKNLFLLAILPFTLLFFTAPFLFALIFGPEWEVAGDYARIFSVYYFFKFVSSPLSYMFYIAEKQRIDFFLHIYVFISSLLILNLRRFIEISDIEILWIYCINFIVIYSVYYFFSWKFAQGKKT